ncbi:type IV toxin-antitoxin system AbiEi family antitoxin domain-containing protein [Pengzhenrongella sp.]|jgi:hypothetical protein|uniref:type IV toxin-antitoxin system AbiEi family antitoxin domain-containing protein n=1 Tax=Pengzhenrongella sp. TaxID=2888820 RepID=UPI002F93B50D
MASENTVPGLAQTLGVEAGATVLHEDLAAAALSDGDIRTLRRRGELERIFRGAYRLPSGPVYSDARYLATVLAFADTRRHVSDPPVIAGPAAVVLHGLPLLGAPPRLVHVARAYPGGRSARGLGIPVGEVPADQLATVAGTATVRAARAALDTARLMTLEAGVVAADAALRRGLTSTDELRAVVDTLKGCRGIERARRCVELADGASESPGESWSAVVLDRLGIIRPERQQEFFDSSGLIGRSDFWWPDQQTVGEFDGRVKYGRANPTGRAPEDVLWSEKVREDRLRGIGLSIVRWTTPDLQHPHSLANRLKAALAR